ncbi:T9SS type B sorting domain-containing protein, partial [Haloflavibacter putidus]
FTVDLGGDQNFCSTDSYVIEATLTGAAPSDATFEWSDSDGVIVGETGSSISVTESDTYTVEVSVDGCPSTESVTIGFYDSPVVDLGDDVSLCGVPNVTLDATPSNASDFDIPLNYVWYQDGTEITGETGSTLDITQEGTYLVEVTGSVIDAEGNVLSFTCTGTDSVEVSTADFTVDLGADQALCDQESYTIEATLTGEDPADATFEWSDSNGVIAGESGQSITVTESDTYTVEVMIDGCPATESVTIDFYQTPIIDLGEDMSTCDLAGLTLDATPSNFDAGDVSYQWSFDGAPISESGAVVTVADYGYGSYEVTVSDNDANSVCNAATASITITERDDIGVSLSVDAEQNLELYYCDDVDNPEVPQQSYTFTANLSNATADEVEFVWYKNGDEILGAEGQSYTVTYDEDGDYADTYEVDVYLGSCSATASIDVSLVIAPYESGCTISEGLSPDTTPGENDCLDLSFLSERTGIKSLKVYNRYGRLVFEKNNYVDSFCGQDKDGNKLPNGTYYYILEFDKEDPVFGSVKKDWIYINRESN